MNELWKKVLSSTSKSDKDPRFNPTEKQQAELWLQLWSVCGQKTFPRVTGHAHVLLTVLLAIPDNASLIPAAADVVAVLHRVMEELKGRPPKITVRILQSVADVIKDRLMMNTGSIEDSTALEKPLERLSLEFFTAVSRLPESGKLSTRLADIMDYKEAVRKSVYTPPDIALDKGTILTADGWSAPTVAWILSRKWHEISRLKNQYQDSVEYADTLKQLWVLLTFYWGSAAVWPKCRHKLGGGEDKVCGEPLLAVATSGTCKFKSGCTGDSAWRCHKSRHDEICNGCLHRHQQQLIGPPGLSASTDIYDALVDRETTKKEGATVYVLKNLKSRKPPKLQPNWMTTYRLQSSALVGVVKLRSVGEKLLLSGAIQWAEIVSLDQKEMKDEWKKRKVGEITLRLLTRGDCSNLSTECESPLDVKSWVAIIDLRVFVPEVISVLSTLSSPNFVKHFTMIPFKDQLLGIRNKQPSAFLYDDRQQVNDNVLRAISSSEIEFVGRLDPQQRAELARDICDIPQIQTLYGTQLKAFTCALSSAAHCVQGPPGTGKSYIGVCLVIALDIIRKKAEACGSSAVGPVLVLSYKNHALDEFLIDILNSTPSFKRPGQLIRTGRAEREELRDHSERHSNKEKDAQKELDRRLSVQRQARRAASDWKRCAGTLKSRFQMDADASQLPQAPFLLSAINLWGTVCGCQEEDVFLPEEPLQNVPSSAACFELIQNLNGQWPIEDVLNELQCGSVHWTKKSDPVRLEEWLCGRNPPPRCRYLDSSKASARCINLAAIENGLCQEHRCKSKKVGGCELERLTRTDYCKKHGCKSPSCDFEAIPRSINCMKHTCPSCIASDARLLSSRLLGRGCPRHQCCALNGNQVCNMPTLVPHKFCTEHLCLECSIRGSKFGQPVVENSTLCIAHKCTVDNCQSVVVDQGRCASHPSDQLCWLCPLVNEEGVTNIGLFKNGLCWHHECYYKDCSLPRLIHPENGVQLYCHIHTCRKCFPHQLGDMYHHPATEMRPRNVCPEHALCTAIIHRNTICNALATGNSLCDYHKYEMPIQPTTVRGKCSGRTTKNKPCQGLGVGLTGEQWWCGAHANQAPFVPAPAPTLGVDEIALESNRRVDAEDDYDLIVARLIRNRPPIATTVSAGELVSYCSIQCSSREDGGCDVRKYMLGSQVQDPWLCVVHKNRDSDAAVPSTLDRTIGEPDSPVINANSLTSMDPPVLDTGIKNKRRNNNEKVSKSLEGHVKTRNLQLGAETADNKLDEDMEIVVEKTDFHEAPAVSMHPDEMNYYSEEEEVEGNQEQRRLAEMDANSSQSGSESDDEYFECDIPEGEDLEIDLEQKLVYPYSWDWSMTHQERCQAATILLYRMIAVLNVIRQATDSYINAARIDRASAGCEAFKRARVVAATVVGAARRLEAIRAAEPFAVVVEEACEVMEPTLMSVLAVRSLKKLELIGDHRQLPAFVQNCWFNLQSMHPSIKTSLFERVITEVTKNERSRSAVPHTVLDEQRRMRSEIADITRPLYSDVVTIVDHAQTARQMIGDSAHKSELDSLKYHKSLWSSESLSIPGMSPCVYFWDIEGNKESRPEAGLSACNEGEAVLAAELTRWFLLCGVPPSAISIITPYKGQKSLLVKKLKAAKCLPPFKENSPPLPGTTVTVSTVDKYQGDENDIVIYSNVRTMPGNRFVAMKERFVVSTSRARMGFYLLGSSDALVRGGQGGQKQVEHWAHFIDSLRAKDGTESDVVGDKKVSGFNRLSRIGKSLPVCCPRHQQTVKLVSKASDFPTEAGWKTFCKLPCTYKIPFCGHNCNLACHSPTLQYHSIQSKCDVSLLRPCRLHRNIALPCKELKLSKSGELASALKHHKCEVHVIYRRKECDHVCEVLCHYVEGLDSDEFKLPECGEIVHDYIQPGCQHKIRTPQCATRRKYEISPPLCSDIVRHMRPCGCEVEMKCHEREAERARPVICQNPLDASRPRCSHVFSTRCNFSTLLQKRWDEQSGDGVSIIDNQIIVESRSENHYGKSESELSLSDKFKIPICTVSVQYRSQCGHIHKGVPCNTAFRMSCGAEPELRCSSEIQFISPVCRHIVKGPCWFKNALTQWKPWGEIESPKEITEAMLTSSKLAKPTQTILALLRPLCSRTREVLRSCGQNHTEVLPCSDLHLHLSRGKELKKCAQDVLKTLQCAHTAKVKCCEMNDPDPVCKDAVTQKFAYSCGSHFEEGRTCDNLRNLRKNPDKKCFSLVTVQQYRCKHPIKVTCHLRDAATSARPGLTLNGNAVRQGTVYCATVLSMPSCTEIVTYDPVCKHTLAAKCHDAFSWACCSAPAPLCHVDIDRRSPLCGHSMQSACHISVLLDCFEPWRGSTETPPFVFREYGDGEGKTRIYVNDSTPHPLVSEALSAHLNCDGSALYTQECGHSAITSCINALYRKNNSCQEISTYFCRLCNYATKYHCSDFRRMQVTGFEKCSNLLRKLCTKCKKNIVPKVACSQALVECNSVVFAILACGHEGSWKCGQDTDPRTKPSGTPSCTQCVLSLWRESVKTNLGDTCLFRGFDFKSILENAIDGTCSIEKTEVVKLEKQEVTAHINARVEILKAFIDLLRTESGGDLKFPPPDIGSDGDEKHYDVVFSTKIIDGENHPYHQSRTEFRKPTQTKYGLGNRLLLLTPENLRRQTSSDDGILRIGVGLAYRLQCLTETTAFNVAEREVEDCARQQMLAHKKSGFDCVDDYVTESVESGARVYWYSEVAVMLFVMTLKLHTLCMVCMDGHLEGGGMRCTEGHFLCWECLEGQVNASKDAGALDNAKDAKGNIRCPHPGCEIIYDTELALKNKAPTEVLDALEGLRMTVYGNAASQEARRQALIEFEAEQERQDRLREMDKDNCAAHKLHKQILDDVLNLKCPKCNAVFYDFSGCFAVSCECHESFCGWCLIGCGDDAHAHVANCRENPEPGEVFGRIEVFRQHHDKRRENKINRIIGAENLNVQQLLRDLLHKDIEGMNIRLK